MHFSIEILCKHNSQFPYRMKRKRKEEEENETKKKKKEADTWEARVWNCWESISSCTKNFFKELILYAHAIHSI